MDCAGGDLDQKRDLAVGAEIAGAQECVVSRGSSTGSARPRSTDRKGSIGVVHPLAGEGRRPLPRRLE